MIDGTNSEEYSRRTASRQPKGLYKTLNADPRSPIVSRTGLMRTRHEILDNHEFLKIQIQTENATLGFASLAMTTLEYKAL